MCTQKVIFRKFRDGQLIALFPALPGTNDASTCLSYQHIGQHGAADCGLVRSTRMAKPEEFAALRAELEGIGYQLRPVSRFTYSDYLARDAAIKGAQS